MSKPQDKDTETLIQLEFLVTRPEAGQLLATVDQGVQSVLERFDTFVNNTDFFNEYSCIYLAESIIQLYAAERLVDHRVNENGKHIKQSENYQDIAYPFIVSLHHRAHFSTIVCLDPNTHLYIDYFQETDRKLYPRIFGRGNFQFFNMDRAQFLNFMSNIYAKPVLEFYQSFLGPLQVRTRAEYLDQAIVERVLIYDLQYISNAQFMQRLKAAHQYIVQVLDTHFDQLDRREQIIHSKERDIAKLNMIYNRILDTALEMF